MKCGQWKVLATKEQNSYQAVTQIYSAELVVSSTVKLMQQNDSMSKRSG